MKKCTNACFPSCPPRMSSTCHSRQCSGILPEGQSQLNLSCLSGPITTFIFGVALGFTENQWQTSEITPEVNYRCTQAWDSFTMILGLEGSVHWFNMFLRRWGVHTQVDIRKRWYICPWEVAATPDAIRNHVLWTFLCMCKFLVPTARNPDNWPSALTPTIEYKTK